MKATVIVPVKDDPHVQNVAAAILAQLPPEGELIVVDDGAPGSLPAIPGARVIALHAGNQALARNEGARAARGDILIFTDADVEIPGGWIETALSFFDDPSVLALQGYSLSVENDWLGRRIQREYDAFLDSHAAVGYADLCDSRCFAIRREVFLRFLFDGFNTHEGWGVDSVLGRRLYLQGVRTVFSRRWRVGHHYPRSVRSEMKRRRRQAIAGALHLRRTGWDLFRGPNAPPPSGLGGIILRTVAHCPRLAGAFAKLLWGGCLLAAYASRAPGRPGCLLFSRACRAAALSGRLLGSVSDMEGGSR